MGETLAVPFWLAVPAALLAAWAAYDKLVMPGLRWLVSRPANQVMDELSSKLRIGIRPFQRTRRQALIYRLTTDPKVLHAAEKYSKDHGIALPKALARVDRYAREIVPAFNAYFYFRIGYWIGRKLARSLYRVRLGYIDTEGIARINPDATVVFVMNHRSNMDYVLAAYLAAEQTTLSYAVGEWARLWPLSALIRAMGAYFVRRNSADELYRRVLERYIAMATEAGVPQAVFPEGGLSRDGRMREPRLGVLDYMMRGFRIEGDRDLVFVPLGINYDRVLEDRTLIASERSGRVSTLLGTLRFVAHNVALLMKSEWHRFGYACVNFGSPVSMREYSRLHKVDFQKLAGEERKQAMSQLGRELMQAVGRVVPVVPVALIAHIFVEQTFLEQRSLTELDLKAAILRLLPRLEQAHVYVPRRDLDYALTVGLRMLLQRRLVLEREGSFQARTEELPLLRYYANSIAHLL